MALDFNHGGYEDLFKSALSQGINLFCGAGFSVEAADKNGRYLPTGPALLSELKSAFPSISTQTSLPRACTIITKTDKHSFHAFLEDRFEVATFNPLYRSLSQISIKNIYTTNIDDLFFNIYKDAGSSVYLHDCSVDGSSYNDEKAVNYHPLHGCIKGNQNYVFGATEIASAFSQRGTAKSWESLADDAEKHPILFWGWNFDDSGPIEAMYGEDNGVDNNTNRWVLLYEPDDATIAYLKALNFNIIIGGTKEMLEYISTFAANLSIHKMEASCADLKTDNLLSSYCVPANDEKLPAYPLSKYFLEYTPRWSHIYSHSIPKTSKYREIANCIASKKNIIVMGIRGSGKTTLMMQLLIDYDTPLPKHMLIAPSVKQAQVYIKLLNGRRSILFIDDCFRDTNALIALFQAPNIQIICFDRDFNYERQYHKIRKYEFSIVDVTEITALDAQGIVNTIPVELQRENAGTKNFEKDPTILNLLAMNLKAVNFKFMEDFYKKDRSAAKLFLMIAYVHACGTPCSFDMVYSFLGDEDYTWQQMFETLEKVGGLVKAATDWLNDYNIMEGLQDYYQCRSRFLAEKIISSIPKGSALLADVLEDFTEYVPAFKICHYDKFRRSAYDADYAERAFPDIERGTAFYKLCARKDGSEYIYQQAAIYFARLGDSKRAFEWIEKARNLAHYNRFSIDSTYARIYFEVNLMANQGEAEMALQIMDNCCKNDKRKSIHFANFAKCCLGYYEVYGESTYLHIALQYIEEGLDSANLALSQKNKHELTNLKSKLIKAIENSTL